MKIYILKLKADFIDLMDEVENLGKVDHVFSMIPRVVAIESSLSLEELEKCEFIERVEEDEIFEAFGTQ